MAWTGGEKVFAAVLSFVQSVILARLLSPHDFGLVAMLSIFLILGTVLAESGLGRALIVFGKNGAIEELERKVLIWNISVASGLYALFAGCAPWIASFYHEPILVPLMYALGAVLPLEAAGVVAVARLQREERFATLTRINAGTTLLGACVGIALAWIGFGVWSIVVTTLSWAVLRLVMLFMVAPCGRNDRCSSGDGSVRSFPELLRYGLKLAASALIHALYGNVLQLLIGKIHGSVAAGLYKRAERWALLPGDVVNESVGRVGFVRMAQVPAAELSIWRGVGWACLRLNVAVLWPCLVVLGVFAPEIIGGVLGRGWLDCVPYLRILLVAAAWVPVTRCAQNILQARGAANLVLVGDAIKVPFWTVFLMVGSRWGMFGLCWAYVAGTALESLVDVGLVQRVQSRLH